VSRPRPLLPADPGAGYRAHKEALDRAIQGVLDAGHFILGPRVRAFEESFAAYLGAADCVGVANGTDALHLALRAAGVGPGDTVITASHTAVATVVAIGMTGATAVLADIDPRTYTLDPQRVEDALIRTAVRPKAVIAVHLYGHPADMDALAAIAARGGAVLVEDCAQSHGAEIGKRKTGAMGICGAFSFYPTKNLGAFGDGGAVATSSPEAAGRLRSLRQYGWGERYVSDVPGFNSRLDEIQAAVLERKLDWLDAGNDRRREIARRYGAGLAGLPVVLPEERPDCRHVYHQYVLRAPDRDGLRRHLDSLEIRTAILYPVPVHLQPAYRGRVAVGPGGLAFSEEAARSIVCLPIYPELEDADVDRVIEGLRSFPW